MTIRTRLLAALLAAATGSPALAQDPDPRPAPATERLTLRQVIDRTAAMVGDAQARQLAQARGLDVVNVMWEDTGRFKGSSVGPNISDVTIQVSEGDGDQRRLTCLPVIRYPNFSDVTADMSPAKLQVVVGNHDGSALRRVSLSEYIDNLTDYLSKPDSWKAPKEGGPRTLFAARDHQVLISAQACFLPVPKGGKIQFNPAIFNYQSVEKHPAVLAIVATRQGTSATIVDNTRDTFGGGYGYGARGQRLFFNKRGERATLEGERKSDVDARGGPAEGGMAVGVAGESSLGMVLLIQIPLIQRFPEPPPRVVEWAFADQLRELFYTSSNSLRQGKQSKVSYDVEMASSDVEEAVVSAGKVEGPFVEIDGLPIERDPRFPIRVTIQFYQATSNGIVDAEDLDAIKASIDRVYASGSAIGSLVTDGDTGRATEHDGPRLQPPDWWQRFWTRYASQTGTTPEQARQQIETFYGDDFARVARSPLVLADAIEQAGAARPADYPAPEIVSGRRSARLVYRYRPGGVELGVLGVPLLVAGALIWLLRRKRA